METPAAEKPAKKTSIFYGLGRNVIVLGFVSLFTDISSEMLYPVIPLFLTVVLHAPMPVIGLIEGIAESTASLLKVVSGWYSDRLRCRGPLVVWGYSISALSKPLLYLASTWHLVLGARVIDRIGKGIRNSPRDAMIAAACLPDQRGKAFGLHRAMDTAGACIGPLLAILMLSYFKIEFRTIFLWAFIPAALSIVSLFFLKRDQTAAKPAPRTQASPQSTPQSAPARPPLSPRLKSFIAIYALFAIGNSSDVFLILKAREVGFSNTGVLYAYAFYNFVYALAAGPAGWLSDRLGRRRIMAGGFVFFAIVYLGFAFTRSMTAIAILFALYGFYAAATEGVAKATVADLSEPANRGTAMGAFQTVTGVLAFAASLTAGLLWSRLGSPAPFYYGAACALAAAILFFKLAESLPKRA